MRTKRRPGLPPWSRLALGAALLAAAATELSSENVTLSTFYPAPSGVYTQILTTGSTLLARDGGNVGVGVANPASKLDVGGSLRVTGPVQLSAGAKNGYVLTSDSLGNAAWKPSGVASYSVTPVFVSSYGNGCTTGLPMGGYAMGTDSNPNNVWVDLKFVGKNLNCIAFLETHVHHYGGGRYEDNGCRYDAPSGWIQGFACQGNTWCGYACF